MKQFVFTLLIVCTGWLVQSTSVACSKSASVPTDPTDTIVPPPPKPFDINSIQDDYSAISAADKVFQWASHNVHDPCCIKDGDYFYCYNTDVAYGTTIKPGVQIRRSKDLIDWQFYGWAFADIPKQASDYIKQQGGTPNKGLWAPYVVKVGSEFRLYYSLSSTPKPRLSTIGLATAPTPVGPWTEKGLVVSSTDDNTTQTNAIDPTVLIDPKTGRHWMYYGSAWDGIYILELNPTTGLPVQGGSRGRRISQRGFTAGKPNGNIEGAEIIYNPTLGKYFLFIAYDWLQTKYNVRVGRSDSPEGPFLDFNGEDLNIEEDHAPMILAPYQFAGHAGYQGVAHCGIVSDGGQFFMLHQARPAFNSYLMNLHVRKILWTPDGWPVVSPERYAATTQTTVNQSDIVGTWERIELGYRVVPGYANEQLSPDLQVAKPLTLNADGTFDGGSWTFAAPILEMKWASGSTEKLLVERGRDWENKKECLVFTGLNEVGTAVWGKK
ncbi:MAG: arabinan endo-1,5-alpha-L-arabinosidase [Saprospiraceae bacterium]